MTMVMCVEAIWEVGVETLMPMQGVLPPLPPGEGATLVVVRLDRQTSP